jgi:hypothetical protein
LWGGLEFPKDAEKKVGCGGPRMRRGVKRMVTGTFTVRIDREERSRVRSSDGVADLARES